MNGGHRIARQLMPLLDLTLMLLGLLLITAKSGTSSASPAVDPTQQTAVVEALAQALAGRPIVTMCCRRDASLRVDDDVTQMGCHPIDLAAGTWDAAPALTREDFVAAGGTPGEEGFALLFVEPGSDWTERHAATLRQRYGGGWAMVPIYLSVRQGRCESLSLRSSEADPAP